ncbi:MAG: SHOCT domain-containing protein [Propionicimonas sp.]
MGDDLGPLLPIGWEWIAVTLTVFVPLVMAAVVTAILLHRNRRRSAVSELPQGGRPAIGPTSLEAQLVELDGLLAQGRITRDEYTAMRSRILDLQ